MFSFFKMGQRLHEPQQSYPPPYSEKVQIAEPENVTPARITKKQFKIETQLNENGKQTFIHTMLLKTCITQRNRSDKKSHSRSI